MNVYINGSFPSVCLPHKDRHQVFLAASRQTVVVFVRCFPKISRGLHPTFTRNKSDKETGLGAFYLIIFDH